MSGDALFAHGTFWSFGLVFLAGFLTSLTPCVFPLITVTVSLFGGRGENVTRSRAMLLASSYVGGLAAMFTSLGVFAAMTGHGIGSVLVRGYIVIPMAILFAGMGASMFGAFDLNLPSGLQNRLSRVGGKGVGGAFGMGLVGGLIAAPCTGPVLVSVLAFVATKGSVAFGAALLLTYSLGMGVLFFAVAAFALSLPKSGPWMEAIKGLFGIGMFVAAFYFLRNVWPALKHFDSAEMNVVLVSCLLIAAGLAVGALSLSFHDSLSKRLRKGLGLALVFTGVCGVIGWTQAPRAIVTAQGTVLTWHHDEVEGLAAAKAQKKPALLDFYADYCLPCKELDIKTFSATTVAAELQRFALIKIDTTNDDDPTVTTLKGKYGATTLPALVLLGSNGQVQHKIDHFVEPAELLQALRQVQ